jgi:hypothetical protein
MDTVKEVWFDVYDGANMIQATRDEKAANRRVFAENCSYRQEKDKTWHVKKRDPKKLEDV